MTLKALNIDQLCEKDNTVFFNCGNKLKSCKPGQNFVLQLKAYDKAELCPVRTLKNFIKTLLKVHKIPERINNFLCLLKTSRLFQQVP